MVNVIVRPDVYERYRTAIRGEPLLWVGGKLAKDDGTVNVIAEEARGLRLPGNGEGGKGEEHPSLFPGCFPLRLRVLEIAAPRGARVEGLGVTGTTTRLAGTISRPYTDGKRVNHRRILSFSLLCLLGLACSDARPAATLVLLNGKIFTGDAMTPWVEALAVRDDRVTAIGTTQRIRRDFAPQADPSATRVIDLGGRLVIPGINDAHVHVPEPWKPAEILAGSEDLGLDEALRAIATAAAREPRGTWIHGPLSLRMIDDPRTARNTLDRVAPAHPVWLDNFAGHATVLNSAGLRALAIPEKPPDPVGGRFGRDTATGELNGWLYESARWQQQRKLAAERSDSALLADFRTFSAEAAGYGITSVQDMPIFIDADHAFRVLRGQEVAIRWRIIRLPLDGVPPGPASGASDQSGGALVLRGVKYILDGTPVERGALLRAPYQDQPGWRGLADFSSAQVESMLRAALQQGDQPLFHCAGDSAPRLVLSSMRALGDARTWRPLRLRVEHGDGIDPGLFPALGDFGVLVVQNPSHFAHPELMKRRYGPTRLAGMFRLRSLLAGGIPVALGSDGPLNPYLNVMFAVTHPNNPAEAISREDAIRAYTQGSAYAEFAEAEKGRLVPGMLADLAVLSQDVFLAPIATLPDTRSLLTVVGGRIVYEQPGAL